MDVANDVLERIERTIRQVTKMSISNRNRDSCLTKIDESLAHL